MHKTIKRGALGATTLLLLLFTSVAGALAPTDVWKAADAAGAIFSADGSSVLTKIATGFQLRRSSDGRVEKTVTLPPASRGYDAYAFSPDKQFVALTYRASGVTRIELFSVANGALVRSIDSGAVRNARGIDLTQGRVALFERYAYGDGGYVRVFDTSTGALLTKQGPYTRNSTTDLHFSPDGEHLAIAMRLPTGSGVRILSTTDWSAEQFLGAGAFPFRWSADSASLFVSRADASGGSTVAYDEVAVPNGDVLGTTLVDSARYYANAVTPDGRFFLATTPNQDGIAFLRAGSGSVQLSYAVPPRAGIGSVSPVGDLFAYTTCLDSGACTLHVARMPTL